MGKQARLKKEKKAAAAANPHTVGSAVKTGDLDFSAPEDAYTGVYLPPPQLAHQLWPGSFRWRPGKQFMALPPPPATPVTIDKRGWASWLTTRCPSDSAITDRVKADPSVPLSGVAACSAECRWVYRCWTGLPIPSRCCTCSNWPTIRSTN